MSHQAGKKEDAARDVLAPHRLAVRVYYEDTDAGGVVYYANYLRFAERGRSEWLREKLEAPHQGMWDSLGALFMVRKVEADYLAPARLDDLLTVETSVEEIGGASLTLRQVIRREKILVTMKIVLVCIGPDGKVLRLPHKWRETLAPQGHANQV